MTESIAQRLHNRLRRMLFSDAVRERYKYHYHHVALREIIQAVSSRWPVVVLSDPGFMSIPMDCDSVMVPHYLTGLMDKEEDDHASPVEMHEYNGTFFDGSTITIKAGYHVRENVIVVRNLEDVIADIEKRVYGL